MSHHDVLILCSDFSKRFGMKSKIMNPKWFCGFPLRWRDEVSLLCTELVKHGRCSHTTVKSRLPNSVQPLKLSYLFGWWIRNACNGIGSIRASYATEESVLCSYVLDGYNEWKMKLMSEPLF